MSQSRQRQAGDTADHPAETENEVTPEMIEAGLAVLREWQASDEYDERELIRRILSIRDVFSCR